MIYLFSVITVLYVIIISILYVAYSKVKSFKVKATNPSSRFSIIIPFRNESKNIETLLNSIFTLKYPKTHYEIILVDDDSEDSSVSVINSYLKKHNNNDLNISIIKNDRKSISPKKDAIATAISMAKFEWIVTTDADCIISNLWLQSFNQFIIEKKPKFIVAPVTYNISNSIIDNFQLHDFLSLQTATVGGFGIGIPFLCNGANLCYSKSVFKELNGFKGNDTIASGDDLFLMEKITEHYLSDILYLKTPDVVIYTKPESSIKSLLNQRIRWASKTSAYKNVFSKILAFIVLAMNASIVAGFVLVLIGSLIWQYLFVIFLIKFFVDFLFILKSSNFFKQNSSLIYYPLNSISYPLFVLIVAFYSMFFKYKWKGRVFNK